MKKRMKYARDAVGLAMLLVLGGGCFDYVDDYGFQLWCGDVLCAWDLEEGHIERAPTWHEADYGVSFVDDPTAISQLVPSTHLYHGCMRFEAITAVQANAEVRLELDFEDDGSVELERTLERADWENTLFYVNPPTRYDQVRIRLVKYGEGWAVVARLRVQDASAEDCAGPPLVSGGPVPSDATSP
jgi:hypothetical protein